MRFFKRKVNIRDRNHLNFEHRSGLTHIEAFNPRKPLKTSPPNIQTHVPFYCLSAGLHFSYDYRGKAEQNCRTRPILAAELSVPRQWIRCESRMVLV